MSKEMRALLNNLVNAAKAQRRQLNTQILEFETLLREVGTSIEDVDQDLDDLPTWSIP